MRSSKSRSRNKPRNRSSVGNVVNRVFDSSGPEGKVRGTPQQIIDKYNQLARDAQLSGDRVATENFQQHSEHYTRMLAEALREQNERREQQEQQQQQHRERQQNRTDQQHGRNDDDQPGQGQGEQPQQQNRERQQNRPEQQHGRKDDDQQPGQGQGEQPQAAPQSHGERAPQPEPASQPGQGQGEQPQNDPQPDQPQSAGAPKQRRPRTRKPAPVPASSGDVIDLGSDGDSDSGLVETPEEKPKRKPRARKPKAEKPENGGDTQNDATAAE